MMNRSNKNTRNFTDRSRGGLSAQLANTLKGLSPESKAMLSGLSAESIVVLKALADYIKSHKENFIIEGADLPETKELPPDQDLYIIEFPPEWLR